MLSRIDFIEKWMYASEIDGYVGDGQRKIYRDIYDIKLSPLKLSDANGYFIQTPTSLSFSLVYDSWIADNILSADTDSTGRYQTKDYTARPWTTDNYWVGPTYYYLREPEPAALTHYDYAPIEFKNHYIIAYDMFGNKIFHGVIEFVELSNDLERKIVSFTCKDMMVLISKCSEKNKIVLSNNYTDPTDLYNIPTLTREIVERSAYYYFQNVIAPRNPIPMVWNVNNSGMQFTNKELITKTATATNDTSGILKCGYWRQTQDSIPTWESGDWKHCYDVHQMSTICGIDVSQIDDSVIIWVVSLRRVRMRVYTWNNYLFRWDYEKDNYFTDCAISYIGYFKDMIKSGESILFSFWNDSDWIGVNSSANDTIYQFIQGIRGVTSANGGHPAQYQTLNIVTVDPSQMGCVFMTSDILENGLQRTYDGVTYDVQFSESVNYSPWSSNTSDWAVNLGQLSIKITGSRMFNNLRMVHKLVGIGDILKFIFQLNNISLRLTQNGTFEVIGRDTDFEDGVTPVTIIDISDIISPIEKRVKIEKTDIDFKLLIDSGDSSANNNSEIVEQTIEDYYQYLNDNAKHKLECKVSRLINNYNLILGEFISIMRYTYRIASLSYEGKFYSLELFKIALPLSITVKEMVSSGTWLAVIGEQYLIEWTCNSAATAYNVKISIIDGLTETIIVDNLSNGYFNWTIQNIFTQQSLMKLRISLVGSPDTYDEIDIIFVSGYITVTNPNLNTDISIGQVLDIVWSHSGITQPIDIWIKRQVANWYITPIKIADGIINTGQYSYDLEISMLYPGDNYWIEVVERTIGAYDVKGMSERFVMKYGEWVKIDSSTGNSGNTEYFTSRFFKIYFSVYPSTVHRFNIYLIDDLGNTELTIASNVSITGSFEIREYSWLATTITPGLKRIKIESTTDPLVNDITDYLIMFKIPTIQVLTPNGLCGPIYGDNHNIDIAWNTLIPATNVSIKLLKAHNNENTLTEIEVATNISNNGLFNLVPSSVPNFNWYDKFKVRVHRVDNWEDDYDESDYFSLIKRTYDTIAPILTPVALEIVRNDSVMKISWAADPVITIDKNLWMYRFNEGYTQLTQWFNESQKLAKITPTATEFYYNIDKINNTDLNYRIVMTANDDGQIIGYSDCFKINDAPAFIEVLNPASGILNTGEYVIIQVNSNYKVGVYYLDEYNVNIKLYQGAVLAYTIADNIKLSRTGYYTYNWLINNLPNGTYAVRVELSSNISFYGQGEDFDIVVVPSGIYIDYPKTGIIISQPSTYQIMWHSNDVTGDVSIELMDGASVIKTISSNTPNSSVFQWNVNEIPAGTNYSIRITSITNPSLTDTSDVFEIIGLNFYGIEPGTISNNHDQIKAADVVNITWNTNLSSSVPVTLYALYKPTNQRTTITTDTLNNGSYQWICTGRGGWDWAIEIVLNSDISIKGQSEFTFGTVQWTVPPTLNLLSPSTNTVWNQGQNVSVSWNGNSKGGNVRIIYKYLTQDYKVFDYVLATAPNTGLCQFVVPVAPYANPRSSQIWLELDLFMEIRSSQSDLYGTSTKIQ